MTPKSKMKIKNDFIINKNNNKMSELFPSDDIEVEFADSDLEEEFKNGSLPAPKTPEPEKVQEYKVPEKINWKEKGKTPEGYDKKKLFYEIAGEVALEKGLQEKAFKEHQENPEEGNQIRADHIEQLRIWNEKGYKRWREKMENDPEKFEEHKKKQREYQKARYAKLKEEGKLPDNASRRERYNAKKGDKAFEEKRDIARKKYLEKTGTVTCECGVTYQNLPNKKERHLASDKHQIWAIKNSADFKIEDTMPEHIQEYISKAGRRTKKEIEDMAEKNGGMRGSFHCVCCDINIHFTKSDLNKHFNSNNHLKNFVKNKTASN